MPLQKSRELTALLKTMSQGFAGSYSELTPAVATAAECRASAIHRNLSKCSNQILMSAWYVIHQHSHPNLMCVCECVRHGSPSDLPSRSQATVDRLKLSPRAPPGINSGGPGSSLRTYSPSCPTIHETNMSLRDWRSQMA